MEETGTIKRGGGVAQVLDMLEVRFRVVSFNGTQQNLIFIRGGAVSWNHCEGTNRVDAVLREQYFVSIESHRYAGYIHTYCQMPNNVV